MDQGAGKLPRQDLFEHLKTLFQLKFITSHECYADAAAFGGAVVFRRRSPLLPPVSQDCQSLTMQDASHWYVWLETSLPRSDTI